MDFPSIFENIRRRPSMYLRPPTVETAIAFVQGYDAALCQGALAGFREWLIVRHNGGNNLSWPAFFELEHEGDPNLTNEARIDQFFAILEAFWRDRHSHDGLTRIIAQYTAWLRRQPWYRDDSSI